MDRRDFLKHSAMIGSAAWLAPRLPGAWAGHGSGAPTGVPTGNLLAEYTANEAPIDTIVVLMMENRSVDHYLGWLAHDGEFAETARARYGSEAVDPTTGKVFDGSLDEVYVDDEGRSVENYHLASAEQQAKEENVYRGCGHPDPGHGWSHGRAQMADSDGDGRPDGFLTEASRNDEFAVGYYLQSDLQVYPDLARRFTTFDRYFCSLLTSTFPNREYMHSAQSGGIPNNALPPEVGGEHTLGFTWDTIWDRLRDRAGFVPGAEAGYFFVDLPAIALWGPRMMPFAQHIEDYFARAASGTLPRVTFVDPGFTTGLRTDDHPYADIRAGQKLVADVVKAFVDSPQWERGVMFINYDEWGGFYDHVMPPTLPDSRAAQGFDQAGFRTPTFMLSPYAKPGFVDHGVYDHTSILRFIEWRYLGAPAHGPTGSGWWLTERDQHAANIGASLGAHHPNPEYEALLLPEVPITSAPCSGEELEGTFVDGPINDVREPLEEQLEEQAEPVHQALEELEQHAFEKAYRAGYFERVGWDIDLRPLPTL